VKTTINLDEIENVRGAILDALAALGELGDVLEAQGVRGPDHADIMAAVVLVLTELGRAHIHARFIASAPELRGRIEVEVPDA
jgi:hypothetical protein